MDNIRWVTQIFVVIYHVFYMYNGVGVLGGLGKITSRDTQVWDIILYAVYPWLMMILFIVSGISSRLYLDTHTARDFIRSRTTKLLVPSTVGIFVFQFIQGYVSMALGGAFETLTEVPAPIIYLIMALSGQGVLWYMQLLWIFSLVLILIRRIEKDRLWNISAKTPVVIIILLSVLIWGAAQILNTPVIIVYRFGLYFAAFILGYFVFSHDEVMERIKRWFPLFAAVAVALCVAFCIVYFGKNYAEAPINRSPLFVGFGYFASIAILGGMARFADFETPFTQWMNKRSFGLYVFHYLGISSVALFVGKNELLPPPAVYLLSALAGFAAGFLLGELIPHIPFFRWAVLGIKKKKEAAIS